MDATYVTYKLTVHASSIAPVAVGKHFEMPSFQYWVHH
jgi:hypothetical protein